MDFLTPELFDQLVIANLLVGIGLIGYRFYYDMTRDDNQAEHREQVYDESSLMDDTQPTNQSTDDN